MSLYWHWCDGQWHAFGHDGKSLCDRLQAKRPRELAKSSESKPSRPKGAYCTTCKRVNARMARYMRCTRKRHNRVRHPRD